MLRFALSALTSLGLRAKGRQLKAMAIGYGIAMAFGLLACGFLVLGLWVFLSKAVGPGWAALILSAIAATGAGAAILWTRRSADRARPPPANAIAERALIAGAVTIAARALSSRTALGVGAVGALALYFILKGGGDNSDEV